MWGDAGKGAVREVDGMSIEVIRRHSALVVQYMWTCDIERLK